MFELMTEEIKKNTIIKVCERCKRLIKIRCKGLCNSCYNTLAHLKAYEKVPLKKCECSPECPEMIKSKDKWGSPLRFKKGHYPKGEDHHCWKGGISPDIDGYISLRADDHPYKNKRKMVKEHRLVYEHYLYILFDEHIYIPKEVDIDHINGIKHDNRLINLRPMYKADHNSHHKKKHINTKCSNPECKSPNETYIRKNGFPLWYGNEKDGWVCNKCRYKIKKS